MHRILLALTLLAAPFLAAAEPAPVKKVKDIVIYKDDKFFSTFPSIVRRPSGELLAAFRRAPNRVPFGGKTGHTDPNSQLVLVRSTDDGTTWSDPELIYADPFGGAQDPCMLQLRDGTILCATYSWCMSTTVNKMTNVFNQGNFSLMGGRLLRSTDGGHTWEKPIDPPPVPGEKRKGLFGETIPAFNRGAMCEGADGRIYWVVASQPGNGQTETHLMISSDKGKTWNYSCPIAADPKITFNETSIYETPKGDLVAFLRTDHLDDHTVIARSTDHGKSFRKWEDAGFMGHPHYALHLSDKRVALFYGYRHKPFGIRMRVLNPECTDFATAPETVLRDDGLHGDLGYPWATVLSEHKALVVYYFHGADGIRYIAGTELEIK